VSLGERFDQLYKANADGTGQTILVDFFSTTNPAGVMIHDGQVYFVQENLGIRRVNLDGTGLTTLVTGENDARFLDVFAVPEPASSVRAAANASQRIDLSLAARPGIAGSLREPGARSEPACISPQGPA
jgi:hypothetical protein